MMRPRPFEAGRFLPPDLKSGEPMKYRITNNTGRGRAFPIKGHMAVVKPGETRDLDLTRDLDGATIAALHMDGVDVRPWDGESEPVTGDDDLTRDEIVAAAIDGLDDDGFTDGGKPKVDAINAALPEGAEAVSSAERDAVWDAMLRDREAASE